MTIFYEKPAQTKGKISARYPPIVNLGSGLGIDLRLGLTFRSGLRLGSGLELRIWLELEK